jgi:hypothetical protein
MSDEQTNGSSISRVQQSFWKHAMKWSVSCWLQACICFIASGRLTICSMLPPTYCVNEDAAATIVPGLLQLMLVATSRCIALKRHTTLTAFIVWMVPPPCTFVRQGANVTLFPCSSCTALVRQGCWAAASLSSLARLVLLRPAICFCGGTAVQLLLARKVTRWGEPLLLK